MDNMEHIGSLCDGRRGKLLQQVRLKTKLQVQIDFQ